MPSLSGRYLKLRDWKRRRLELQLKQYQDTLNSRQLSLPSAEGCGGTVEEDTNGFGNYLSEPPRPRLLKIESPLCYGCPRRYVTSDVSLQDICDTQLDVMGLESPQMVIVRHVIVVILYVIPVIVLHVVAVVRHNSVVVHDGL